jgi:hypothetical protein
MRYFRMDHRNQMLSGVAGIAHPRVLKRAKGGHLIGVFNIWLANRCTQIVDFDGLSIAGPRPSRSRR